MSGDGAGSTRLLGGEGPDSESDAARCVSSAGSMTDDRYEVAHGLATYSSGTETVSNGFDLRRQFAQI